MALNTKNTEKHYSSPIFITHFYFSSPSYLLPDAKKSTKCRTKSRKGKDPLWNEQFLIVGVNFHDVKRRALEICIADSHTSVGKKAKFVGGVRLSLGYKAVVAAQTEKVNQVLRLLKGKGGMSGGRKNDKEETDGTRERKVSFSNKETVIANVNTSFAKWKRASGNHVPKDKTDSDNKAEIDADRTAGAPANNNTGDVKITVHESNASDVTRAEIVDNEQQSASSTSTEDMTAAWDSAPDPTANSEQESGTSPDKTGSDKLGSDSKRSAEELLFHSVLTSIKQLEIAARYSVTLQSNEDEEFDKLFSENDKEYDMRAINSSNGRHNEDARKEEKQESDKISAHIIDNDAEQEENGFKKTETLTNDKFVLFDNNNVNENNKREIHSQNEADLGNNDLKEIEIQRNCNLTDERFLLNDIKGTEAISYAELESENPTDPSENSRTEHDQNSVKETGNETRTIIEEAITEEKPTKEEILPRLTATETRELVKTREEKPRSISALPHQEIKVDSLESEHIKAHGAATKTYTGSNEMKRSPSFTFKDLGKKLNFRRRSKSDSEETGSETGLETNANKVMLDAQGLEITQWTLVVDRPKQWHYCWHILRPEMTILH